jgi:hypothetical protein
MGHENMSNERKNIFIGLHQQREHCSHLMYLRTHQESEKTTYRRVKIFANNITDKGAGSLIFKEHL